MKLIMENWRGFLVENKKQEIKDLKFGEMSKELKKRLGDQQKIIDIRMSDIPISKYPDNNSSAVKKELKQVLDAMTNNREISKKELKTTDKKPMSMFVKYLKENDIDHDKKFLQALYQDSSLIALKLKARYDRPRPEQLGPMVGYDIKSIKTETDDTPSFPSGHTLQAWTMAYYLASKHQDHKSQFFEIAEKIEKSRIIRGAHYPSDNKESKKLAEKYLFPNIKEDKK